MIRFALALLMQGPGMARGCATTQLFAAFAGALMTTWFVGGVGCGMGSAVWRKRIHWRPIYPHSLPRVNDFFKHHQQFLFKTPQLRSCGCPTLAAQQQVGNSPHLDAQLLH